MASVNTAHAALLVLMLPAGWAGADPMTGDPARGLAYARAVCTDCHIVEPSQERVIFIHSLSFAQIAADARMTEMGIRAFLQTTHTLMPDFVLTRQQTDDLVAYILSQRPATDE